MGLAQYEEGTEGRGGGSVKVKQRAWTLPEILERAAAWNVPEVLARAATAGSLPRSKGKRSRSQRWALWIQCLELDGQSALI